MNHNLREFDDLKTKIQTFRVSDLQSLVASFGRSRNGKKQELQNRAIEILRTHPSDVDMLAFKRKINELFRIAQDEAKQTHYDFQPQRTMNQPGPIGNPYMVPGPYSLPPQTRLGANPIIYQNGAIVSGNGFPNQTMYPVHMNAPTIQPPPMIACNLGDTVRIISPPISYSNITFKTIPFYRVKNEILKPTILKLKTNSRNNTTQIFQISFVLTCDIASVIAMHRDYTKNEFIVQAQLRICAIDNSNSEVLEYDDLLPLGLFVRMNDKQCSLPPCSPCTRPNVEARRVPLPINVTQFLKLSPMNVNKLTVNWTPEVGRTFVACLNVVEKLSSTYLMDRLKEKPPISVDVTKQIIAKQYKRVIDDEDDNENADDDDIATTIVRVSLQCPLAKFRMMYPAKGKNCSHLQCFDGFAYISCNEKKSVWMCPVCNRSLYYDDLLIDQYFVDVLASKESIDCQEVQLFEDGSWKVYDEEDTTEMNDKQKTKSPALNSPSENLSLASSEEYTHDSDQKNVLSDNAVSTSGISASVPDSFVDLTEDDEETEIASEMITETEEQQEHLSSTSTKDTVKDSDSLLTTPDITEEGSTSSLACETTPSQFVACNSPVSVISPSASTLCLNLSSAISQETTADEADSLHNLTSNPVVLSPSPPLPNPMVLSPSLSPMSRIDDVDMIDDTAQNKNSTSEETTLEEDNLTDKTNTDVTMGESSVTNNWPNSDSDPLLMKTEQMSNPASSPMANLNTDCDTFYQ